MKLFDNEHDYQTNLLPKDGTANYYGQLLPKSMADFYLRSLINTIPWKSDKALIYGKVIKTKRKVAWYGDLPFEYTYSNTTKNALPWTRELLELKGMVEQRTAEKFNACLLNLYDTGKVGMAWHSDAEKDLKKNGAIGSLSLGAERRFVFKHKLTAEKKELLLEHGSLLIMKDNTQTNWLHRVPPMSAVSGLRINLTFRTIVVK